MFRAPRPKALSERFSRIAVLPLALTGALAACGDLSATGNASGNDGVFFSPVAQARVYPLSGNRFEVVPPIGSSGATYICAAGDYARRALGAGWTSEFYVEREMGMGEASGRINAVVFSMDPVASASESGIFRRTYRFQPGDSYSVQDGHGDCGQRMPFFER